MKRVSGLRNIEIILEIINRALRFFLLRLQRWQRGGRCRWRFYILRLRGRGRGRQR